MKLAVLALVSLGTRVVDADDEWYAPPYRAEPVHQRS